MGNLWDSVWRTDKELDMESDTVPGEEFCEFSITLAITPVLWSVKMPTSEEKCKA